MKLIKSVLVAMLLGIMAIQVALADMDKNVVKLRQDMQMDRNLIDSISIGDLKAIKYYIRKGANVNANVIFNDGYITTPLLSALKNEGLLRERKKEMIEYLISKGANVNASVRGNTALHLAITNGETELVELLIDKGADVNATDRYGRNALHTALDENDTEIAKLMIDKGADVNAEVSGKDRFYGSKGYFSITPFKIAVIRNNVEMAKYLLDKGVSVNAGSSDGRTPLLFVIDCCSSNSGSLEFVKYLVNKGADVNARDIHGQTALMYVAGGDDLEIVKYLVSKGADVNAKDNQGKSVFDRADKLNSNDEIFEFLLSSGAKCDDCDE